jgi:hypothetical protein
MILNIQPSIAFTAGKVGAFADMSFADYRAAKGINKSGLSVMRDNPRRFILEQRGQINKPTTAAMQYGSLLHEQVFFGRADIHIQPETYGPEEKPWNNNAKECRAWRATHADKPCLTEPEAQQLGFEADCVLEHPQAAALIKGGHPELSIFARAEGTGHMLKGRLDYYGEDISGPYFVDLKTTIDASTYAFSAEIYKRRYHVQFALYRRILVSLGVPDVRVFVIALEKGALPRCNVRQIAGEALDIGDADLDADLALYRQFRRADWWPDFADKEYDRHGIPSINLPDYVLARSDNLSGMTLAQAS